MKRLLSILLALAMLTTLSLQAEAAERNFSDVHSDQWYYAAVYYCADNHMVNGTSATTFSPNDTMTRSQFVTILGRMDGVSATNFYTTAPFADVRSSDYFAPYVTWAAANGITSGTGTNTFSPDMPVTREQIATFVTRYLTYKNVTLPDANNPITAFMDAANISDYAVSSVETMRRTGIVSGYPDGRYGPQRTLTRAEGAMILMRLRKSLNALGEVEHTHTWVPSHADDKIAYIYGNHADVAIKGFVQADTLVQDCELNNRLSLSQNSRFGREMSLDITYLGFTQYTLDDLRSYATAGEFAKSVNLLGYYNNYELYEILLSSEENTEKTQYSDGAEATWLTNYAEVCESYGAPRIIVRNESNYSPAVYMEDTNPTAILIAQHITNGELNELNLGLHHENGQYIFTGMTYTRNVDYLPDQAQILGRKFAEQYQIAYEDYLTGVYTRLYTKLFVQFDFTYHDAITAWIDEMESWSGHWDWLLYGDEHFKYYQGEKNMGPGFGAGNWWSGYSYIIGEKVVPGYRCATCGALGTEILIDAQDGRGAQYKIVAASKK